MKFPSYEQCIAFIDRFFPGGETHRFDRPRLARDNENVFMGSTMNTQHLSPASQLHNNCRPAFKQAFKGQNDGAKLVGIGFYREALQDMLGVPGLNGWMQAKTTSRSPLRFNVSHGGNITYHPHFACFESPRGNWFVFRLISNLDVALLKSIEDSRSENQNELGADIEGPQEGHIPNAPQAHAEGALEMELEDAVQAFINESSEERQQEQAEETEGLQDDQQRMERMDGAADIEMADTVPHDLDGAVVAEMNLDQAFDEIEFLGFMDGMSDAEVEQLGAEGM